MATVTVLSAVTTAAVVAVAVRMTATEAAVAKVKKKVHREEKSLCISFFKINLFSLTKDIKVV